MTLALQNNLKIWLYTAKRPEVSSQVQLYLVYDTVVQSPDYKSICSSYYAFSFSSNSVMKTW